MHVCMYVCMYVLMNVCMCVCVYNEPFNNEEKITKKNTTMNFLSRSFSLAQGFGFIENIPDGSTLLATRSSFFFVSN